MNKNETIKITDLEAVNAEEIKGGPRLTIKKLGGGLTEEALSDLEPAGDVLGGVTKVGPGTLVLANANTYRGTTTVNNGGTL